MPEVSVTRQLKDIISQAERLKNSHNFQDDLADFSVYNEELKAYLHEHYDDPMIFERVQKLPHIKFNDMPFSWLYYLFIPMFLIYSVKLYIERQRCMHDVEDAKSIYSSLLFLLRNE